MSSGPEPRRWLYGLTADEWLHLACEGENSEVAPCCGNLGVIRDGLKLLATTQEGEGNVRFFARHVLADIEADGDAHDLGNAETHPLLHRVLAGIRGAESW